MSTISAAKTAAITITKSVIDLEPMSMMRLLLTAAIGVNTGKTVRMEGGAGEGKCVNTLSKMNL